MEQALSLMIVLRLRRAHQCVIGPHGWFKREIAVSLGMGTLEFYFPGEGPTEH
jgi:hypothetical protein